MDTQAKNNYYYRSKQKATNLDEFLVSNRLKCKEYQRKNSDKIRKRKKMFYQKHIAKMRSIAFLKNKSDSHKYSEYKKKAKSSNTEFAITKEEFAEFRKQNCYYCGIKPISIGLDRIDNDLGYIKNNILPCCKRCNVAKNNQTLEEFMEQIKRIYERHLQEDSKDYS